MAMDTLQISLVCHECVKYIGSGPVQVNADDGFLYIGGSLVERARLHHRRGTCTSGDFNFRHVTSDGHFTQVQGRAVIPSSVNGARPMLIPKPDATW